MVYERFKSKLFFLLLFVISFTQHFSQCNSVVIDSLNALIKIESNEKRLIQLKRDLGTAYTECGYYVKGLDAFMACFALAEKLRDTTLLCVLNNNIAIIYHEIGKENISLEYALKAIYFGERQTKKNILADAYNTLGNYYYTSYQDSLAFKFYRLSLKYRILEGDKIKTAVAYNNLGDIYYEIGETEEGIRLVKMALELRQSLKNYEGVSLSYEVLGEMYLHKGQLDSALVYFNKFKPLAGISKSLYVLKSFYDSYADLCHKLKLHDSSYLYQKKFIKMNDSILNVKSSEQFAEMQTKYETEKKEDQIKLSALEIEKEKEKSFYTTLASLIIIAVLIVISFLFYSNYNIKQKRKFEEEMRKQEVLNFTTVINTLEKERNRIAAELHDNTGALVSFIITKTDWAMANDSKKEDLLLIKSSAQEVMTSLRETLWTLNNKTITSFDLIDKLKIYIKKHVIAESKISEETTNEVVLPNDVVLSLYRCAQEIINNINKHSKANLVTVHFTSTASCKFGISIEDNGIGFTEEEKEDNYGIRNLKNRMNQINAQLLIKSTLNEGTKIEIFYG